MKPSQKGIVIAVVAFLIMFIADLVSTLIQGEVLQYLEANPIYKYTGMVGIVVVNILLVLFVYWVYNASRKPMWRFIWMNLLVTMVLVRIPVLYNNLKVYASHPTVVEAMQVTAEQKVAAVVQFAWLAFIPYLIALISFFLFQVDHKIEIKT